MKNNELINYYNQLSASDFNNICNGKFQYAIQKNIDLLAREVKAINRAKEKLQTPELLKFLQLNQADALEKIKTQIQTQAAAAPEQITKIEREILKQYKGFTEIERDFDKWVKANTLFMNEESEFKPWSISPELIESIEINQRQIKTIWPLIANNEK